MKCFLDTKSSGSKCKLTIIAHNDRICKSIYDIVKKRIHKGVQCDSLIRRNYIMEIENLTTLVLHKSMNGRVVFKDSSNSTIFEIKKFKKEGLYPCIESLTLNPKSTTFFDEYTNDDLLSCFDKSLRASGDQKIHFSASPGKLAFHSKTNTNQIELNRKSLTRNGHEYLREKGLNVIFSPNLKMSIAPTVKSKLESLGFHLLNSEPEHYTIVHLTSGNDDFHVKLALNDNLNTCDSADQDMRLSEDKKIIVQKILECETIGEVMKCSDRSGTLTLLRYRKLAFRKLSLLVNPDKNKHPRAADAFKVLNDANEKLMNGNSVSDKCLKLKAEEVIPTTLPPKIISVKKRNKNYAFISTISSKSIDLRAKLRSYNKENGNSLPKHITDALNKCWEQRKPNGDIPVPKGTDMIHVDCIKQVKEAYYWTKELKLEECNIMVDFHINVKYIRESTEHGLNPEGSWQDIMEIDFKIDDIDTNLNNSDEDYCSRSDEWNKPSLTGKKLFQYWNLI